MTLREKFPLSARVRTQTEYFLPVGSVFEYARRKLGNGSPFLVEAAHPNGPVYQFTENEVELFEPEKKP